LGGVNLGGILVLLIGGRYEIPVLISIKELSPSCVEFIVSKDDRNPKFDNFCENIRKTFPSLRICHPEFVGANDIEQVQETCWQVIQRNDSREVTFNLTPGTKIMALGAYDVIKENALRAIYIDTRNSKIILLGSQVGTKEINARFTFEECIKFWGREKKDEDISSKLSIDKENAISLAEEIGDFVRKYCNEGNKVLEHIRKKNGKAGQIVFKDPYDYEIEFLQLLLSYNIISKLKINNEVSFSIRNTHDVKFLDGKWLEIYAWKKAKEIKMFDDVIHSVKIPYEGVGKEIDVACVYKGQLIICSCKTGNKSFETEHLDELQSVASLIGKDYCSKIFITAQPGKDEQKMKSFMSHAEQRKILVVTGDKLVDIGDILQKEAVNPTLPRI